MPKLKELAQFLASWASFPNVSLHRNVKVSLSHQELTQELKKFLELTQDVKPMSGTKSSYSGTKLRTLRRRHKSSASVTGQFEVALIFRISPKAFWIKAGILSLFHHFCASLLLPYTMA